MKKLNLTMLGLLALTNSCFVFAGVHTEHSGKNLNTGSACKEAKIGNFKPAALSEVAPSSEFSFMIFDAINPKQIEVTVKSIVVTTSVENKGDLLLVHGNLPETLKGVPARVIVKVKGKQPKCDSETGWLLKIKP